MNSLINTNTKFNLTSYRDLYPKIRSKNFLKKIVLNSKGVKYITKSGKKKGKLSFRNRRLYKNRSSRPKRVIKNGDFTNFYYFTYNTIFKSNRGKYKTRYKKYLLANSKQRIEPGRDKLKYTKKKILSKTMFSHRFLFKRLPRLFFFWFIILYSDVYLYLSQIVWNNWIKFLYTSFGFGEHSKLFYSVTSLYNTNYVKQSFLFSIYNANRLGKNFYNGASFLNNRLSRVMGTFFHFFFNGAFFNDLRFISMTTRKHVNLYISRSRISKKNVKLKRFFVYKA